MKVVFLSSLDAGGPISHLRYLLPALAQQGVEPHVVCGSEFVASGFRRDGIDASVAPIRGKHDLAGARALTSHVRRGDVVHSHDRRTGLFGRLLARRFGLGIVHTYHGLPEPIALRLGRPEISRFPGSSRARELWLLHGYLKIEALLARLGLVIVPSRAVARFLVDHGLPADRLRVIPSAIDVRRREPAPAKNPLVVGTVGALEYVKGVDVLLAACAQLEQPVALEIFGDGDWRRQLEQQAARLGVQARFHGHVTDIRSRVERFDVLVVASRAENLPLSILEAMSSAVPVIATRVGGVPELLDEGRAGVLVEPEDADGLARAIAELLRDPERRARLGRLGASRVEQEYRPGDVAQQVTAVYEEVRSRTRGQADAGPRA